MPADGSGMNEPQYWIAQGENVQGPFARSVVRQWIADGRVRADMLFSLEGGAWVQGHDCPELFPTEQAAPPALPSAPGAYAAPVAAAPAPSRGGSRRRRSSGRRRAAVRRDDDYDDDGGYRGRRGARATPPGSVMVVVVLDFIGAALYGFAGIAGILLVAAAKKEGPTGPIGNVILLLALVSLVMAAAYLVLGILIKGGSNGARITQMVLSAIGILLGLVGIVQGGVDITRILGLAINILIVVLLMGREASVFFAESGGRGMPRRRGGGRRSRRRRRRY